MHPSIATNKKVVATLVPLNLRRVPEQAYLGKVIGSTPKDNLVFATPHGLLIEVRADQLSEPTAEQHRELGELEEAAVADKKQLYGGDIGLREFIKLQGC